MSGSARAGFPARTRSPPAATALPQCQLERTVPTADSSATISASCEERIRARLRETIGANRYGMWFGSGVRLRVEGSRLEVEGQTGLQTDWIRRNYSPVLEDVARQELGAQASHCVTAAPTAPVAPNLDSARGAAALQPRRSRGEAAGPSVAAGPRRAPCRWRSIEELVVGASNRLAVAAVRQISEQPASASRLLFIHGSYGVGKTHLLEGLCRLERELRPNSRVRLTGAEAFLNEYITAVRAGSVEPFRRTVRKLDLLVIDDLHCLSGKTGTQQELLQTMEGIANADARIAIVADAHPRQVRDFAEALRSRFLAGLVVEVEQPDAAMRAELVERLAHRRGLAIRPEAAACLAGSVIGGVREIEGIISRLLAERLVGKGLAPIELLDAQRVLRASSTSGFHAQPVRAAAILSAVCDALGVGLDQLRSPSRHRQVTLARGVAAALLRELTCASWPEIATQLGRSTHSTAHTAAARVRSMAEAGEVVPLAAGRLAPAAAVLAELAFESRRRSTPTK